MDNEPNKKSVTPKKTKIIMVVSGFPYLSETFISLQIAELYRRGYDITVLTMGSIKADLSNAPDYLYSILDKLKIVAFPDYYGFGFRRLVYFITSLMVNSILSPVFSVRLFFDKVLRFKLAEFVRIQSDAFFTRRFNNASIIHCQYATIANKLNKRLTNLKKMGFLNIDNKLVSSIRGYDITKQPTIDKIDWEELFNSFKMFLPVCNHFAGILNQMGCKKNIKVVHSPVNTRSFSPGGYRDTNEHENVRIISVGRLVEKKGFDNALKAIFLLSRKYNHIQYKIIGDGALRTFLENMVVQHNISDIVEFTGSLSPDKTLEIMAESDILLNPSKTAYDGDSEGIPNALKEGMLLGLQVVATKHSGIPELIEHNLDGFLVSENNPDELAEVLEKLLNDRTDWHDRSEKARNKILNIFSIEKTTDELISAYNSIICDQIRN